jgi:hypothetical protein
LGHSENASSVSSWAENAQRVTPYPWAVCEVDRAGKWALHKLSTIIKNNFVPRALAKADKTGGSMNSNLVGSAQTIVTWIIFLSKIHIFQRILVVLKGENEYTLATHSNLSNSFK